MGRCWIRCGRLADVNFSRRWRDRGQAGILICPIFFGGGRVRGLKTKRILITGGASGIGAATAARFLEEGSAVCVLDRDVEARRKILRELPSLEGALDADVSNLEQVHAAFAQAIHLMS